jgi:hypothetical protein
MTLVSVDLTRAARRQRDADGRRSAAIFAGTRQAVAVRGMLGLGLAASSLALPWLGLTLSPSLSAWHLALSLGAVPLLHHISYGMMLAVLLACATVSFVRSKGRPTACTRAVGWAFLASPLIFAVTTRLVGAATMFTLQSDASQTQIINSQFLTNNNIPAPTQFLGVQVDPKTLVFLYALRLGWYTLLIAGVLLAGRVPWPSTWFQRSVGLLSALAALTVVAALALGAMAQDRMNSGIQAITDGRSASGAQLIGSALRLNPSLAYNANLEQALGQAQADEGLQTGLAEYTEAVRPVGKDLTLLQKAQLFGEAVADIPANAPAGKVVRADLATFLATATITSKNPDLLALVDDQLGSPALTFSVGRYYYEAGADSLAIATLEKADGETGNSEVRSLCRTYLALAWLQQGNEAAFRANIVAAVRADRLNENVYAREIAAGLYVPGAP